MLRAVRRIVHDTRPPSVGSEAVQPEHVVGAPIADHRGHARLQSLGELGHRSAAPDLVGAGVGADRAAPAGRHLREPNYQCLEFFLFASDVKGGRHLEGLRGVYATAARTVLLGRPITSHGLALATAKPATRAERIHRTRAPVVGVQGGEPRVLVCLLHVNLRTRRSADSHGIAVVVAARADLAILPHVGEIERGVATATSSGEVDSVPESLAQELNGRVAGTVIAALLALVPKVGSARQVGYHRVAPKQLHLPRWVSWIAGPSADHRDLAVALHVDRPRALAEELPALCVVALPGNAPLLHMSRREAIPFVPDHASGWHHAVLPDLL
mmetsp:Transcript_59981/g.131723  ORF Transcript_59981/g.131723 Transcript_59981/m.131723 type:complete len:328 (-) Transcript_59981:698-1681(-)